MKTFLLAFVTMIFSCASISLKAQAKVPPYKPESKLLHDTIAQMDSLFFEAYNNCRLKVFETVLSEDLEFYHDRGGLSTSKKDMIAALKNNICNKVTRGLLKGSIEVYPIPGYGAVQMGAHRFHNHHEKPKSTSRYSKFVHTWKREPDGWKLTRVISLH